MKMKQSRIFPKIANDMFFVQLLWAFKFLGVALAIHIFKIIQGFIQGYEVDSYYNVVFVFSNIFILVVGILSGHFLPKFVENGVTRKDYFKGTLLSSIGLSAAIPIILICISQLEQLVIKNMGKISFKELDINSILLEIGDIRTDIVHSIFFSPFVDPKSNLVLAIAVFTLNLFMYYLVGWLISASFYRFANGIGIGFIVIAFIILTLEDVLLRISLDLPVSSRFEILDSLPLGMIVFCLFVLIFISIWIIRLLTKRVSIKM